jgi:hypothetical protein
VGSLTSVGLEPSTYKLSWKNRREFCHRTLINRWSTVLNRVVYRLSVRIVAVETSATEL